MKCKLGCGRDTTTHDRWCVLCCRALGVPVPQTDAPSLQALGRVVEGKRKDWWGLRLFSRSA